jgi:hypothetical protein
MLRVFFRTSLHIFDSEMLLHFIFIAAHGLPKISCSRILIAFCVARKKNFYGLITVNVAPQILLEACRVQLFYKTV